MYISKELQENRVNELMIKANMLIKEINEKFYNEKPKYKIGVKKND